MPAIWSFWYGYNSKIYDRQEMSSGVPTNYSEQRLMWILNWVQKNYQIDPNRWYCSGSSMGGCGTVSFGLRRPELFASLHALIPIVSYTYDVPAPFSAGRLEPSCWVGQIPANLKASDGVSLLDRMNGTKFIRETQADLPPLYMIHGRQDGSIPWVNNPPFYRAMAESRQPFAVYWDNGIHSTAGKDAPADVKNWQTRFRHLRRDESYPAFTHTSTDRNPGDGRPDHGDIVGWINRGMDWRDVDDLTNKYAMTISADYPGISYPVTTDVTLRRLQQFRASPEDRLNVTIGDASPVTITAGEHGLITIPRVAIPSAKGVRLVVRNAGK
jgi:predicted esterase